MSQREGHVGVMHVAIFLIRKEIVLMYLSFMFRKIKIEEVHILCKFPEEPIIG
jgi:hypothetical protein